MEHHFIAMTPNHLYALPPVKVDNSIYAMSDGFPEVDFSLISAESCPGLAISFYADHCYDGERVWQLAAVSLEGKPFMVLQSAGRGGRDFTNAIVTDAAAYKEAVSRLTALYETSEEGDGRVVGADDDIPEMTSFYGESLEKFYDPTLSPKYKEGDVLRVRVLENHLDWMGSKKIVTRVRIGSVNPMNPHETYHGCQIDRCVKMEGGRCCFVAAEDGAGTLGAQFNDRDVVEGPL